MAKAGAKRAIKELARPSPRAVDFSYVSRLDFISPGGGVQQRSIESRARIIAVARSAFIERSYESVSTHEISAEANVTQGLVTYHFESKEGLWRAVMDDIFASFRNSLAARIRELQGLERRDFFIEVIRHMVRTAIRYPGFIRVVAEATGPVSARLAWLVERHVQPIYDVVTHLFEVGQFEGVLRRLPVTNAYFILLASGGVFAVRHEVRLVSGLDSNSPDFEEGHMQCVLSMLLEAPI